VLFEEVDRVAPTLQRQEPEREALAG